MSNKQNLQQNNTNLSQIKTTIENLPARIDWTDSTTITPTTSPQTIPPYVNKEITIEGDSNFTAENIKNGVEIWGITGTMPEGVTGISYGQFTVSNKQQVTVNHGLGVKPKVVMMYPISITGSETELIFHSNPYFKPEIQETNDHGYIIQPYRYLGSGNYATSTATTITFDEKSTIYPISGTYGWVAII